MKGILVLLAFLLGLFIGARGYYTYANHIYMKYPEFFLEVLQHKIERKKEHN